MNPITGNVAESTPTILLYLKDGTVFPASDYWVADNTFHFRVDYGGESAIPIDQLDLQRTVDENAKRNIRFALKPKPDSAVLDPGATALNIDSNVPGANAPAVQYADFNNLMQAVVPSFASAPQTPPALQPTGTL
jgi:hypothetical protein